MSTWSPAAVRDYYLERIGLHGNAQESTQCPFHNDESPSLSVNLDHGSWTCHAGCGNGSLETFEERYLKDYTNAAPIITRTVSSYVDETGAEQYQIIRLDLAGEKTFHARHKTEDGAWISNLQGIKRLLYRLPAVNAAQLVIVVEGEKCVHAVEALQLGGLSGVATAATCNPFGAGKWNKSFADYLKGKKVWILPDNDKPGREHAETVARALANTAMEIKIVHLPDLKEHADIADFIELRGESSGQDLVNLAHGTSFWMPNDILDEIPIYSFGDLKSLGNDKLDWIVRDLLRAGGLSLIAGKPKTGKSTLARQFALSVARGATFLGRGTTQGSVLYYGLEDSIPIQLGHFNRMGMTDDDPIKFVNKKPTMNQLKAQLAKCKPSVLVIDPIYRFIEVRDTDKYIDNLKALSELAEVCNEFGVHACVVHHAKKGSQEDTFDGILGSTAIFGTVEVGIVIKRDSSNTDMRLLETRSRVGIDIEPSVLRFDPSSGTAELGETFEKYKTAHAKEQAAVTEHELEGRLLEAIQSNPAVTQAEIRSTVNGKGATISKLLRQMVSIGKLTQTGEGLKADPFRYSCPEFDNAAEEDGVGLIAV